MCRVKHRIKIMCALFNETNVPYDLLQGVRFRSYHVKLLYGSEMLSYHKPGTWNLVFSYIRGCGTEQIFRQKIKKWKLDRCTCRLCKIYV